MLFLHDLTRLESADYRAADAAIGDRLRAHARGDRLLDVYNKADTAPSAASIAVGDGGLAISAVTGAGLDTLRARLLALAGWHAQPEGVFIARTRHVQALQQARAHLGQARTIAAQGDAALDLFAEELRLSQAALGKITGEFGVEDLLGEIFSRFCIGK